MVPLPLLLLLACLGPGPRPARAQLAAKPTRGPHPASPCPSVFSYEGKEPDRNRWYGVVLVSTDDPLDGMRLNVKLTHRAQILGNFIGDVTTADNMDFTILSLKTRINPGPPLPIRIFAAFGDRDDIPYIETIKLNGRTICSGFHSEQQTVFEPVRQRPIRPEGGLEYEAVPALPSRNTAPPASMQSSRPVDAMDFGDSPPPTRNQPPPSAARPTRPASGVIFEDSPSRNTPSASSQRPSRPASGLEYEEPPRTSPPTRSYPSSSSSTPLRTTTTTSRPVYERTEDSFYPVSNSVSSAPQGPAASSPRPPPREREGDPYRPPPVRNHTSPTPEPERGIYKPPSPSNLESPRRPTPRPEQDSAPQPWPTSNYDERERERERPPTPGSGSGSGASSGRPLARPAEASSPSPQPRPQPSKPLTRPTRQSRCGTIAPPATPLIINGETSIPGKWPWHVALYKPHGRDWKYQCGGTLVSPTVVVTAAHCVTTSVGRPVGPESLLVFLGKHALRTTTEDGVQDKHVYFIHVHPGYNYTNYRNDIAVLILSSPAAVTSAVRPVCLWDRDRTELSNVEGKFGTVVGWRTDTRVPETDHDEVVGWGIETDGLLTEELHQALMPVVSPAICIYSYPSFFGLYTSNQTYCAGYSPDQLNAGTSVCNGDSGGGMFFKRDEEVPDDEAVWMLRGLVSLSVRTKQDRCDPSHFVVFTDVAKYGDWLENFLAP